MGNVELSELDPHRKSGYSAAQILTGSVSVSLNVSPTACAGLNSCIALMTIIMIIIKIQIKWNFGIVMYRENNL